MAAMMVSGITAEAFSLNRPNLTHVFSIDKSVSGKITSSEDNTPIPGVSVVLKGSRSGTNTDADGNFKIDVPDNGAVLVFSSVGFITQEVAVGAKSVVDIKLESDMKALSEVVVVGYGSQKKSQTTGAISSVSAKQISEMPITNIGQAMQGRVAGVDVSQSGSKPGSTPKVLIRGRRSFNAGNNPLYVVDGIPLAGDRNELMSVRPFDFVSGGYEDMNPNDVASMEILKDATATAIYGARGANGVVLITTKRGESTKGKTTVSYDTYVGVTDALDKIRLFSGPEFAEYMRESRRGIASGSIYKDANGNPVPSGQVDAFADSKLFEAVELDGIAKNRTTDYQDMILRQGFQQNHSVGVQGGNEKTQFYISGGFFRDKGISEGLDYTRTSLRANIDHNINSRVKVGISSYLMYSVRNGKDLNPYGFTLNQNPLGRAYDDAGKLIFAPTNDALLTNPLAEIVPGAQVDERKKYRIFNSLYTEVKIIEGLKYRINFGPDFAVERGGRFIGAQTNARKGGDPQASIYNQFGFNWTLENIVTYNKTFAAKHNLGITALHSVQRENFEANTISVQGVPAETQQFYSVGNANAVLGVGSVLIPWTLNSYMARINYDYADKYLVTVTARRDGSSRFGENTKYGTFPGVALGWNISNEPFMKSVSWLDLLKLRVSYGSVGNQGVAPYQTQGLLGRTIYAWDNTPAYGYRPNTIGNPDLRWESSATKNVGIDFSFIKGRVQGSLELYETNTTDLLLSDQLPASIGFNAVTRNVGETRNRGIELGVSTINVNAKNGFKWTTDFQFTKNTEEIISLYNGAVDDLGNKWFIGYPLSEFFDYKKAGIWQTNEADAAKSYGSRVGQIKVADVNGRSADGQLTGQPDGKINADDRQKLGSDVPDWSGGITNRFNFKGFDLSFFIYARQGQMIISGFHRDNNALAGRYQQMYVDYWTPNNPTNEFPQPNKDQEFPVNNQAIIYYDGSFVKIRNINFGYTFTNNLTKKLGLESLRLFASIQQPKIWSKYRSKYNGVDPETSETTIGSGVTPATRVSTIGLNVKF
ncbi:TonB-dependent receptor [Dyadobacter chenhuakuii]|uniref:TonB-dependent receptor n=2 Tax=Dyadobacter chenhuakuii TaxID=2909339 RepID=A0ABY4XT30_9BACT|nr:TonB-dependent receptor [Dyadobacter chenhuakuii]MCF2492493.1 TonB-dependent receptor [Dyadobacter chenhuakuii]USJ33565.1 TonB-dependent receptor [Dyadobacter chenhuakuii]